MCLKRSVEMENERITLKRIAEEAGVSIGTVDRALNNRAGVNEASKQRVLEVARALGYRPNLFASALSRKSTIRIGVVFPAQPAAFYREIENGIDQAASELADYGVTVEKIRFDLHSAEQMQACLRGLIGAGFDGLAINAAGQAETEDIDQLVNAGIPVVTFNTDALGSKRLFYIGSNTRESGRMAGELLSMLLGGEGYVTVLGNFARTMPFLERFGGFIEYMQSGQTQLTVYPCMECGGDAGEIGASLETLLSHMPELKGIFCTGYSSTIGTVNALKRLNRRDIRLIGYDLTDETVDALRDGWCDMLLYQEPFEQGYQAARLLARHLLNDWLPRQTQLYLDTQIVVRSNMMSCLHRKANIFGRI